MPAVSQWPRWAVMQALNRVRERVARGHPSLAAALHYERPGMSERTWIEMDRVIDGVCFDLTEAPSDVPPSAQPGEGPGAFELRELLKAAKSNAWLPWESPGGLTRGQVVAVLSMAVERVRAMPPSGHGPLFPSTLPIIDRSNK